MLRWRGLLEGTRALFRRMEGCGAQLRVFGPTEHIVADGRGETLLYTGQNPSLSSLFYFEHPNRLPLTNCGCVGCLGGGWIPLRVCIS